MADFTSREADERDTEEKLRERANAAGHLFVAGARLCNHCQVGLAYLAGRGPVPRCPGGRKDRTPEREHSGNKYHRRIHGLAAHHPIAVSVVVDVYSVLAAFPTGHPGCDHAAKKILCAGLRGKGTRVQDLQEARDALTRAIEDAEREAGDAAETP